MFVTSYQGYDSFWILSYIFTCLFNLDYFSGIFMFNEVHAVLDTVLYVQKALKVG